MTTRSIILATAIFALAAPSVWAQGAARVPAPQVGVAQADVKATGRGDHWRRADADGDGQISRDEWLASRRDSFSRVDADGDGSITREEYMTSVMRRMRERLAAVFERLDTDGDGIVSEAESAARGDAGFARMDKNQDGFISEDEAPRRGRHGRRGK